MGVNTKHIQPAYLFSLHDTMSNQFSVQEWKQADDRLSIVLLDLSGSTQQCLHPPCSSHEAADHDGETTTILSYSKDYVMRLSPVLARGRCVVIGCSSRCDTCAKHSNVFCECPSDDPATNCTRVLFRSEGPCEAEEICQAVAGLEPEGQTYVAAPIAALPSVALEEVELQQRQRTYDQSIAFMMALHHRLGAASPARVLPPEVAGHILGFLGNGTIHARVIMAIDGDNNVGCGKPGCSACSEGNEDACPLNGPGGVTKAVQSLIKGGDGLKINVEMNVTMVGKGSDAPARAQLEALCTATGGRYDAVEEEDRDFIAETFQFFEQTVVCPPKHVEARVQAVKTYSDMVRARKVLDCGVKTVFVGKDKTVLEELVKADGQRTTLCQKIHGVACDHGDDRAECLRACKQRLSSSRPFYHSRPSDFTMPHTDFLGELLDCSLFIAKNFKLLEVEE